MRGRLSVASMRRALGALAGLALVAACAFVVSACGSSSASPVASTAASTGTTGASGATVPAGTATGAGLTAYRNCLQSHGVTLPQGGAGGFFARGATGARGPSGAGGFFRRGATGAPGASGARGPSGAGGLFRRGGSGPTGARGFRGNLTAAQQKALSACATLRPAGAAGGFGGGLFDTSSPAAAKFVACLKQHGIQAGSTADRTSTTFQTAFAACRSLLPAGAGGFLGGGGSTSGAGSIGSGTTAGGAASGSTSVDFARFQACLKKHGIQPGAAGQSQSATSAALAACRTLLPNNGNGTAPTTTTTG